MKESQELAQKNFEINKEYEAIVVNNADPLFRGRLQVDIFGITQGTNKPWAESKADIFGCSNSTVGLSSVPKIGSLVYVMFKYNNPSYPIVTGAVRGNQDSSKLHTIQDLGSTISGTRTNNLLPRELPPLNGASVYPNNNVIETNSSVIELDDTPSNLRVSIQHKNGSYFEIRPDGTVQFKSIKDLNNMIKDNVEEYIGKNFRNLTNGLFEITASGGMQITANVNIIGGLAVTGTMSGAGDITVQGEIADGGGNLSSLRDAYDSHQHTSNGPGNLVSTTNIPDPGTRASDYTWVGGRI